MRNGTISECDLPRIEDAATTRGGYIASNGRVCERDTALDIIEDAATTIRDASRHIAGDRAISERDLPRIVDAAAGCPRVAGDRTIDEREFVKIGDTAAECACVAGDRTIGESKNAEIRDA